jgi:hypothetical protein
MESIILTHVRWLQAKERPGRSCKAVPVPRRFNLKASGYVLISAMPSERTKVILLGLRRSGKTSIQQVLFNNLTPKKSFFLETTTRIIKHSFE